VKSRGLLLLAAVVAVCLVLLTLQSRGQSSGAADVLGLATAPIQAGLAKISRGAAGLWSAYVDWKSVRAENRRLREEIQRLQVEALRVNETAEENARLRRLLAFQRRLPLATLAGEVIAREWGGWVRSLTVNRGRGDHIVRLTAVIAPEGLVGRIVDVRPGTSVAQVLTDPTSNVSAHIVRTRTPGIVEGDPRGTVRFKFMARDGSTLQVGDIVVTSGLGGLFPRGIPIGRVQVIDDRGSALFHYATLAPSVDFARVDEVLLIVGDATRDVAGAFTPDG
jgi:rod shape-determining protein MreC